VCIFFTSGREKNSSEHKKKKKSKKKKTKTQKSVFVTREGLEASVDFRKRGQKLSGCFLNW